MKAQLTWMLLSTSRSNPKPRNTGNSFPAWLSKSFVQASLPSIARLWNVREQAGVNIVLLFSPVRVGHPFEVWCFHRRVLSGVYRCGSLGNTFHNYTTILCAQVKNLGNSCWKAFWSFFFLSINVKYVVFLFFPCSPTL